MIHMEPIQVGEHTFIGVEVKLPKTTLLTTPTPVVTSCVVCLRCTEFGIVKFFAF
ncbi:uncharacterized protein YunC (DUF1805 family) [Paenibacillus jamilae]|nr:uncharacterized protein YunC (DUF1805 family) [Paenibacillus jamilae]